jgi:hypothetical protein
MKYLIPLLFLTGLFLYSCNNDPVSQENQIIPTDSSNYSKIYTAESGGVKFEMWSATGNGLFFGYNDIGFKVFINGVEKKSGFVKFYPKMYHSLSSPMHSSPVKSSFPYDNSKKLFLGYACFTMLSDSSSFWYGFYNYNDESHVDSVSFNVSILASNQMKLWDDMYGGYSYTLTLINPMHVVLGANTFTCLMHRTQDDKNYYEVDSAQMIIKPWMRVHGHGSTGNVNPVWKGNGIYEGKAMFTMPGNWDVYDTIKINGTTVTKSPPPYFSFDIY